MTGAVPLACNMDAFNPQERARHEALTRSLFGSIAELEPLADGYAFRFDVAPERLADLGEWAALERLCCPFLEFTLTLWGEAVGMRLTGPEGTPDFLREEFRLRA